MKLKVLCPSDCAQICLLERLRCPFERDFSHFKTIVKKINIKALPSCFCFYEAELIIGFSLPLPFKLTFFVCVVDWYLVCGQGV